MSNGGCIGDAELVNFVDRDLPLETLEMLRAHVVGCQRCRERERALRSLIEGIAKPLAGEFDASAHARSVLAALDVGARRGRQSSSFVRLAALGSLAAGVSLALYFGLSRVPASAGIQARGGVSESSLARDVGIELYAGTRPPRALASGASIDAQTALSAGFRNLGRAPAFLLLFAVDANGDVHWLAPEYTSSSTDPQAVRLATHEREELLGTSAVLADVAPGPLRLVAVLTPTPHHVSEVEKLPPSELTSERIAHHFAGASVRELAIRVNAGEAQ